MQKIDYSALSPEMQRKLAEIEARSPKNRSLLALDNLNRVSLLILDALQSIQTGMPRDIEFPETPDYSQPIVDAVGNLETSIAKAIKTIDVKPNVAAPNVKVNVPDVNVDVPEVDLKGVEKAVKELKTAFKDAIKLIPKTEVNVPETDLSALESRLDKAIDWLESIDHTSRIKPQFPSTMKVTNLDGSAIGGGGTATYYATRLDKTSTTNVTYVGKATPGTAAASATWQIMKMDKTGDLVITYADGNASFDNVWNDRVGLAYS